MATSREEFEKWLALETEQNWLEFKEAMGTWGTDDAVNYSVGIANIGGGKIVLGVTNDKPRVVVGSNAFQGIQVEQRILDRTGILVILEEFNYDAKRVVILHVPGRPPGRAYSINGKHLTRVGAQLLTMPEDQLREIHREDYPDWSEEISLSGVTGKDVFDLLDFHTYFRLTQRPAMKNGDALAEFAEKRFIQDRGGLYDITNLGAILLGRTLTAFDKRGKAPRLIVYPDTNKLGGAIKDIEGNKGYSLAFELLLEQISFFIPENEVIGKALRKSTKMYPEEALREVLANALIHQDFTIPGDRVKVEIFTDRIEFYNPGKSIIPPGRFIDSVRARNERLANSMRLLHIGESRGQGMRKIINAAEVYQLPAPDFLDTAVGLTVILYAHKEWDEMNQADKVRACY